MPRRKYGHMVGPCPPTPKEKCRACRLGYPCPVHNVEAEEIRPPNAKQMRQKARKKRKGRR